MHNKKLIFVDTEFSTLNPYKGEILSIGMVKENGEELYLELEYNGSTNKWVRQNILPTLKDKKVSRKEAREQIRKFVGRGKPIMVGLNNKYDAIYLYKLLSRNKDPFYWIPIDFASILFAEGINPKNYDSIVKHIGIDRKKYPLHNALGDAKFLRECYLKLRKGKKWLI